MRKFVIKNRQKRKYTKKSEEISTFSFSKTVYGMLPLLVMLIAFMSTIVISTPLRDSLSNINISFNFELPEISFANPLDSLQAFINDVNQIHLLISTVIITVWISISHAFVGIMNAGEQQSTTISNITVQFMAAIFGGISFLVQDLLKDVYAIGQNITFIGVSVITVVQIIATTISQSLIFVGSGIATTAVSAGHTITFFAFYLLKVVITISVTISQFVLFIIKTLWMWFTEISVAITTAIGHIVSAIVHVIEIPFKVLGTFGLAMKPYADFLGKHIAMTGTDFNNGVASLGKVASLMGPSK